MSNDDTLWLVAATTDTGSREDASIYYSNFSLFRTKEAAISACLSALPNAHVHECSGDSYTVVEKGYNVLLIIEVGFGGVYLCDADDEDNNE